MFRRSEEGIIRIVGKALQCGIEDCLSTKKLNGKVSYYTGLKEIVLWDMAKKDDMKKLNELLQALLGYLELRVESADEIRLVPINKKVKRPKKKGV